MAVNLQVPVFPAGVDRLTPTMLVQVGNDQAEQLRPIHAFFAPVYGAQLAADRQGPAALRAHGKSRARRTVAEQPRAVALPGADERLDITQRHDQKARRETL